LVEVREEEEGPSLPAAYVKVKKRNKTARQRVALVNFEDIFILCFLRKISN